MPIYEYCCPKCGERFEELETVADRKKPHTCPACGAKNATLVLSTFAAHGTGGSSCSRPCPPSAST